MLKTAKVKINNEVEKENKFGFDNTLQKVKIN